MKTLYVQAPAGIRVPLEDNPRRYIAEEVVAVTDSAYYRRRIKDGDLYLPTPFSTSAASKATVSSLLAEAPGEEPTSTLAAVSAGETFEPNKHITPAVTGKKGK